MIRHGHQSDYQSNQVSNQIKEILSQNITPFAVGTLQFLQDAKHSKDEILTNNGLSNQTKNKKRDIYPLLNLGWIKYTVPENPANEYFGC